MSKYVQNYRKSVILTVRKCSYRFYFTVKYKIFANFTMIFFEKLCQLQKKYYLCNVAAYAVPSAMMCGRVGHYIM